MEKPIQKILIYLQENMNGIGIIMNESGLSSREKTYYRAVNDSLKTTKEYVESFLNNEDELLRQNREMKEALGNMIKEFQKLIDHCENEHFLDFDDESNEGVSGCNKAMKQARVCLTSCNKGKE